MLLCYFVLWNWQCGFVRILIIQLLIRFLSEFLDLFESTLSLNNKSEPSVPNSTQYKEAFPKKPVFGRPSQLKRPPNLRVDACKYKFLAIEVNTNLEFF